jgi:hypothetical protein
MSAGRARLTAAAIVFVAWLGLLGFMAFTAGNTSFLPFGGAQPRVVSRPQLLVADLVVVAGLKDGKHNAPPPRRVPVPVQALGAVPQPGNLSSFPWGALLADAPLHPRVVALPTVNTPSEPVGKGPFEEVAVKEVLWPAARAGKVKTLFVRNLRLSEGAHGWEGEGDYVLAVTEELPREGDKGGPTYLATPVPRSPGYEPPFNLKAGMSAAPIYRDTPEVRRQVEHLIKTYHGK